MALSLQLFTEATRPCKTETREGRVSSLRALVEDLRETQSVVSGDGGSQGLCARDGKEEERGEW